MATDVHKTLSGESAKKMADRTTHNTAMDHGTNAKSLFLNVLVVIDFSLSSDSAQHVRGGSLRIWHRAVGAVLNYFVNLSRIVKLT